MADNSFELFVTLDRNLPYQQNLKRLSFTIFVLRPKDNTRETLRLLIPTIFGRLAIGELQNVIEVA